MAGTEGTKENTPEVKAEVKDTGKDEALAEKAYAAAAEKTPVSLKTDTGKAGTDKPDAPPHVAKVTPLKAAPSAAKADPAKAATPAISSEKASPIAAPVEVPAPVSLTAPVKPALKVTPKVVSAPKAKTAKPKGKPAAGAKAPAAPKIKAAPAAKVAAPKAAEPNTKIAKSAPAAKAAPKLAARKVKIINKPAIAARAPTGTTKAPVAATVKPVPAAGAIANKKIGAASAGAANTSFAGLISNFMLEDTTMDMSANFNAFQDAVTEAQTKAKAAFEKSSSLFGEFGDFTKGNLEAVVESGKILAEGLQGLGSELVTEGRTSFATLTGDIKELAAVKSPTDFFKLQGDIMRKNFDTAVAYGSKNSETMLKLVSDAVAPISGRVSVAMEKARHAAV